MKFDKELKQGIIIYSIVTMVLVIAYLLLQYLIQGLPFEYRLICYHVSNYSFGIAFFLSLFLGGFFIFLKISPEESVKQKNIES
jgi:hypothetical protein